MIINRHILLDKYFVIGATMKVTLVSLLIFYIFILLHYTCCFCVVSSCFLSYSDDLGDMTVAAFNCVGACMCVRHMCTWLPL